MGHEILEHDNVVLHKKPAWHGLGITTDREFTPREGLTLGGIEWGVGQRPAYTKDENGQDVLIPGYVANYRLDTTPQTYLGLVSSKYHVIQNVELADFCSALIEEGSNLKVTCETVGTIRNGALVWFLLKGEAFEVAMGDLMYPYVLVSNGHDGGATLRVTPTEVRAVCSNTIHMSIPYFDTGELGKSAISIRHTVNVMERVQEARNALKHYGKVLEGEKRIIETLASKDVNTETIQKFFLEGYQIDYGPIPTNPQSKVEQNQRDRANSAFASFTRRFDDEKKIAGTSMWCMLNAYTGMVQHDQKARGKDDSDRVMKRIESNLFGLNADRTSMATLRAFKMALA